MKYKFVFTPENLLHNLDKLGGWSAYGLAETCLQHFFPSEFDEFGNCDVNKEIELLHQLGCTCWQDAIVKYHNEVGYTFLNPEYVNEH